MAGEDEFDIVVIGGGPGGYATALYGAAAGLSVAIVERDKVGGTCLHRGCIPAKEFLETATVYRTVEGSKEFGIDTSGVSVDFSVSQDRKNAVVGKLHKGLAGLLKGRKITTLIGTGTLKADHRVEVVDGEDAGRVIVGRNVVLAAGSVPFLLPGFEVDGRLIMTSDEFLDLTSLPASAVVIGGGVVGCEFASLLADLGTKVTILEALDTILPGCDDDITRLLIRSFKKRGIDIVTGVKVEGHTPSKDGTRPSRPKQWSCRWAGAPARKVWWPTGWASRWTGAASWRPTSTSAPASTACGPWVTSWPAPRSWPTWDSPRRSWP
jgi:dihydrolipoamide dehydrogenase